MELLLLLCSIQPAYEVNMYSRSGCVQKLMGRFYLAWPFLTRASILTTEKHMRCDLRPQQISRLPSPAQVPFPDNRMPTKVMGRMTKTPYQSTWIMTSSGFERRLAASAEIELICLARVEQYSWSRFLCPEFRQCCQDSQ